MNLGINLSFFLSFFLPSLSRDSVPDKLSSSWLEFPTPPTHAICLGSKRLLRLLSESVLLMAADCATLNTLELVTAAPVWPPTACCKSILGILEPRGRLATDPVRLLPIVDMDFDRGNVSFGWAHRKSVGGLSGDD